MAFNVSAFLIFIVSSLSIIALYTNKIEPIRIFLSIIGIILGLIPITISVYVLLKQKSSRVSLLKREFFRFLYSDLFEAKNAEWSHKGQGFFCNQAMVEPVVLRRTEVYLPSLSDKFIENYKNFGEINVVIGHVCNFECNHYRSDGSKLKRIVNGLIFIKRLQKLKETGVIKRVNGLELSCLKNNELVLTNGMKFKDLIIIVQQLSLEGKVDLNENECHIKFFKNKLNIDLIHKLTLVKTKIINEKCTIDKLYEILKMVIRHSQNLSTGYCVKTGLIRRGVEVIHSITYQDYFNGKYNYNFNKVYIENDFIVEGGENIPEYNDFLLTEYYLDPLIKKYGETLAKTIISHNKDFWGDYNFNALDYIFRRHSARYYRTIGPNYRAKKYLSDVSSFFEKSGLPRLTHIDLKVNCSRLGLSYYNQLPKDVSKNEGKEIKVKFCDYSLDKARVELDNIKNNKNKGKNKVLKAREEDENKTTPTLKKFKELETCLVQKLNKLEEEIKLKPDPNDQYRNLPRSKRNNKIREIKATKSRVKDLKKSNASNTFNKLNNYISYREKLLRGEVKKPILSQIVKMSFGNFSEGFKANKNKDEINHSAVSRDHNNIVQLHQKEITSTNDFIKKISSDRRVFNKLVSADGNKRTDETIERMRESRVTIVKMIELENESKNGNYRNELVEIQEKGKEKLLTEFTVFKNGFKPPKYSPQCEIILNNYYNVLENLEPEQAVQIINGASTEEGRKPCMKMVKISCYKGEIEARRRYKLNKTDLNGLKESKFTPRKKRKILGKFIRGEKCGLCSKSIIKTFEINSIMNLTDRIKEDMNLLVNNVRISNFYKKIKWGERLENIRKEKGKEAFKNNVKEYKELHKPKKGKNRKINKVLGKRGMTELNLFRASNLDQSEDDIKDKMEPIPKSLKLSCRGTKPDVEKFKDFSMSKGELNLLKAKSIFRLRLKR